MNNNNRGNNNNNRRRGRGNNNNNRQGGGGQQLNRVDSRARGNAPQMLEKYRKMAHDAHLNGDRVSEEYYLQFAEHYFRVIADQRLRQEEQRVRRDDRSEGGEGSDRFENDDAGEYAEAEYQPYDQSSYQQRPPREDRPQRDDRPREDRPQREERQQREDRPRREDRPERQDRNRNSQQARTEDDATGNAEEAAAPGNEAEPAFEPTENPFVRGTRGLKPRRENNREEGRRPRREDRDEGEPAGLDPTSLPPAIARAPEPEEVQSEVEAAETPKPKARRARKPKPEAGDGGALETVS